MTEETRSQFIRSRRRFIIAFLLLHAIFTLWSLPRFGSTGVNGLYSVYLAYTSIPVLFIAPFLPRSTEGSNVFVVCLLVNSVFVAWLIAASIHRVIFGAVPKSELKDSPEVPENGECSLGATGDDWISFKEMVTGRPPIVQLNLPATVDVDIAMRLLPDLSNLKSLSIATDFLTDANLQVIADLDLESLAFHGAFPCDRDIEGLHRFKGLQFLTLRSDHLSAESIERLRVLLPKTKLEIR